MNIPDGFPSAVRWYGNHFLDSFLCILNHNFYEDIGKGCCAPQMRQDLDQYPHRNIYMIKHKKGDFRVPELRFPKFRICDFEPQEYSWRRREVTNPEKAAKMIALIVEAQKKFKDEQSRRDYDLQLDQSKRKFKQLDPNAERQQFFMEWRNKALTSYYG